jgi:hypothetical protein
MEDQEDNLPTDGKKYYMSHSEYFYSEKEKDNIYSGIPISMRNQINFLDPMKLSQLVCASNRSEAKKAVLNQLNKEGKYIVTKCRIDYLIVGD